MKTLDFEEQNQIAEENKEFLKEYDEKIESMTFHHLPQKNNKMEFTLVDDIKPEDLCDYAIMSGDGVEDLIIQGLFNFSTMKYNNNKVITIMLHLQWRGSEGGKVIVDTAFPLAWLFCPSEAAHYFELGLRGLKALVEVQAAESSEDFDFHVHCGVSDHIYAFANALVLVWAAAVWLHCYPHVVRAISAGAKEHGAAGKL